MSRPYPELQVLQKWVEDRSLTFQILPGKSGLVDPDAITLRLIAPGLMADMTVFDEYGDARPDSPLLCLLVIQREIWEVEEHDFAGWVRAHSLNIEPQLERIYATNRHTAAKIGHALGNIPNVIGSLDWELNAGAVQYLRGE